LRYFLGVDGGSSKTVAMVIDETGALQGWGRTEGSNYQSIGIDQAVSNIRGAIDQALSAANLRPADIHHAVYGLAGADRPKDLRILKSALGTLPIGSWRVVCDTMIGLRSGSPTYTGIVLVCGSGTNAAGRNRHGDEVQIGGFGYMFGDSAGGSDLAREAFRMAIRSWEGRESPSVLTERVPRALGFPDVATMFHDYLDHGLQRIPLDLAVVVHEAADEGDALAVRLLQQMGRELGVAAHAVALRLDNLPKPFDVVLVGSVLQKGRHPIVLGAIEQTLQEHGWTYRMVIPEVPPVCGAMWLALEDRGVSIPKETEIAWSESHRLVL
jgi:N-acetylglucosamine kinase-like BadF-type ATPase